MKIEAIVKGHTMPVSGTHPYLLNVINYIYFYFIVKPYSI
jgi:hypothetical protein